MSNLRGNRFDISKTPEEILSIFESIAVEYGLISNKQLSYFVWDRSTIHHINWLSKKSIQRFLGAWRRERFPTLYQSCCGADYLRIKNHYLGFFHAHRVVVKVFLDFDSYQRHIEGSQRFNEFGFQYIQTPVILKTSLTPMPHTLESLIVGENYQIIPLNLQDEMIEELATFHYECIELKDVVLPENDRQQIDNNLHKLNLSAECEDFIQTALSKSRWKILEGEVHGDINRGNMIRGADSVYLMDWEFFSRGPIGRDMAKLYMQAGDDLRDTILKIYQQKQDQLPNSHSYDPFFSSLLFYTIRLMLSLYSSTKSQYNTVLKNSSQVEQKILDYEKNLKNVFRSMMKYRSMLNL